MLLRSLYTTVGTAIALNFALIASAACAAPAIGTSFPLAGYKVTNTGPTKLQTRIQNGTLVLSWPGGMGEAIVEHNAAVSVTPELLSEGFLRYTGSLNVLNQEYGAELSVQLLPVRENGKPAAPYFARSVQYGSSNHIVGNWGSNEEFVAAPNQWATVDFNYKPTANIAAVKPRFVLRGNAMTVAIKSVSIGKGLTWERGRPKVAPEKRDFDEQRVSQILEKRPQAQPQLIRREGRIALEVNGQDVLPACYTRGIFYPQYARYGEFAKAGYNLVRLTAHLSPLSKTHQAGVGNLWRGKDSYDFSDLERELKVIANINPEALVIVSTVVMPYHAWAGENPNSIVTNAKGEKLIVYGGEGDQYGGVPNYNTNREADYAPSFYGGQFPEDAGNAVKALAAFLQTSPAGKIVVGVEFAGGTDGQIYPWDRDHARGADYSPAGLAGWRKFLKERYKNDVALLQRTWKVAGASFENATVPPLTERSYGSSDAVTPRGFDYNEFISHAIADFMIGLGNKVKEGSQNRLLTGVYYSDSGEQGAIARGALQHILESPAINMGRSVMRHQTSGSWWRHGKLTWLELDMRPPMPSPMQYFTQGLVYTPQQFQTKVWRNAVLALTDLKGGFYPYDMAESWYQEADIIGAFGKVRAGLQSAIDDSVNVTPSIGLFTDERLPFQLPDGLGYVLTRTSAIGTYRALDRSGIPYARYLLSDALDPEFTLPKISFFRLPATVTPAQVKLLQDKAKRSGSILIWEYAPDQPTQIGGIPAKTDVAAQSRPLLLQDAGALTTGLNGRLLGTPPVPNSFNDALRWDEPPLVFTPQPGDKVLAHYAGTTLPGVIYSERNGVKQIAIGRPGTLSPQFMRNIAQSIGIQPFSSSDDEMRFGSGILGFYSERGGERTVTLPQGFKVAASPTGHSYKPTAHGFTYTIGYRDMAVFKIVND